MATYTKALASTTDASGSCVFSATIDDVTFYMIDVTLTNTMTSPGTLTITRVSDGATYTFVAQPQQTITQNLPPNTYKDPRSYYPNSGPYSFSMS